MSNHLAAIGATDHDEADERIGKHVSDETLYPKIFGLKRACDRDRLSLNGRNGFN
jgi:hypothetical protein